MTTEDALVIWLRARIAEDRDRDARVQRRARELYRVWHLSNPYTFDEQADDVRDEYLHAAELFVAQEMPAVLAECDAHEAILDFCVSDPPCLDGGYVYTDAVLARLALAYQHRPGYREEWRP